MWPSSRPDMAFPKERCMRSSGGSKRNVRSIQYEKSGTFAFLGRRDELCIRNINTQLHDRMTTAMKKCYYSQAPLPFVGQKRMFASEFRKVLKRFSDRTVFVDLFGGSGLYIFMLFKYSLSLFLSLLYQIY